MSNLFRDATLDEFINAMMMSQIWGRDRAYLSDFFGNNSYTVTDESLGQYEHRVSQWVMKEFFEKRGMKVVSEVNLSRGACSSSVYENIEVEKGKYFRGYKHATIGYENSINGEKALVQIDKDDFDNQFGYKVYASPDHPKILEEWIKFGREKNMYHGKKITASCEFLDLADVSWDEVILPEGTKKLLQGLMSRITSNRAILLANKLSLKRGLLLSGSPGSGKTSIVRVLMNELPPEFTAIVAQPSHMRQASDVKSICDMAKDLAPCLLVIEDIDWIAEDREHSGDAGKLVELMNQMDGLEDFKDIITLGTTNSVDTIENAIKNRPGRFDRVIKVGNPDDEGRRQMIDLFTKNYQRSDTLRVDHLVKITKDLSGAHMRDLCCTAAEKAIDNGSYDPESLIISLKDEHFEEALKEVRNKDYSTYQKSKSRGEKRVSGFGSRFDEPEL